jgi:acetyl esterase/lipase
LKAAVRARDSSEVLTEPPVPPADARVVYGPEPKQFGDLRLLPGDGPQPLAVVLHGGAWRATYNLIHAGPMCVALHESRIATWNVEYRSVGDVGGGWPGTGDDVARAVEFVEQLVDRYPLDRDRVVLVGHSAGGHLGLWAAKRAQLPVVALAPVSDLRESAERIGPDGPVASLMGGMPDEHSERYAEASPIDLLPLGVRQVLVHGTEDDEVPYAMSERYVAAAGDDVGLITLPGARHFEPIDPQSREWPRVLAAIRAQLGL